MKRRAWLACNVCGLVPRQMWLFAGRYFWVYRTDHHLCPTCAHWAEGLGVPVVNEREPWD